MKKLIIVSSDTPHVYNYLSLIEGYFDEVLLISNRKNPDYKGRVEVADFSLRNPLAGFFTPRKIRSLIKSFAPDVVHVHQANSYAHYTFKAAQQFKAKKVLTAWGSDILLLPKVNESMRRMVCNNIQSADAVTADAGFVAKVIKQLVPDYRNEILVANFGISMVPESRAKEKVIYSNRLHKPLYRIDKILAAFDRFAGTSLGQDWRLVIAATGDQTESLKQIAGKSKYADRIVFAGWVDKVANAEWYSKASVFVSVPESDATSISLLEAMAFGCIPIVSDLPANREWIQNGVNGIVAEDLDSDFITPALALDQERVRTLNSSLIMEHGTKEANRRKFIKLYDQLLK